MTFKRGHLISSFNLTYRDIVVFVKNNYNEKCNLYSSANKNRVRVYVSIHAQPFTSSVKLNTFRKTIHDKPADKLQ